MATIKSKNVLGQEPAPIPVAQELVTAKASVAVTALQIDAGLVVQLLTLPANCVPTGYVLSATDLDTGTPAITLDFGILNDAGTAISTDAADGGAKWLAGSTLAQAGGIALHTASKTTYDVLGAVQPVDEDRVVAVVVAVDAATAAAGTIGLELTYEAA